jgi:hypothetical protein
MTRRKFLQHIAVTCCCGCEKPCGKPAALNLHLALRAIRFVESSNRLHPPDGDAGAAIGPFQLHARYWLDGTRFAHVTWPYTDARRLDRSTAVVTSYLLHYCGPTATIERYCRTHNGGPRGASRRSTLPYWRKCQRYLQKERDKP